MSDERNKNKSGGSTPRTNQNPPKISPKITPKTQGIGESFQQQEELRKAYELKPRTIKPPKKK